MISINNPKFKVDNRAVRERYALLADKLRRKLKEEKKASGIDTDMTETESALEELIEKEDAAEEDAEAATAGKKRNKEAEKVTAEEMRKRAMERMGGKGDGEKPKKKRSNGSDTLLYLREKNESMQELRKDEFNLKKKELELQEKKHDDFIMKVMIAQQQQQSNQFQDFQAMMMGMMARFTQK